MPILTKQKLGISALLAGALLGSGMYTIIKDIKYSNLKTSNITIKEISSPKKKIHKKLNTTHEHIPPPPNNQIADSENKGLSDKEYIRLVDTYENLYDLLLQNEELDKYSNFIHTVNSLSDKFPPPTIIISDSRLNGNELEAFLENDTEYLLESSLQKGKLLDAAILSCELDYPTEVAMALYDKGRSFKDGFGNVYWDMPFSDENIDLQRFSLKSYMLNLVVNRSGHGAGAYQSQMSERLIDIVADFPDKVQLSLIETFAKDYSLNTQNPTIKQETERRIEKIYDKIHKGDVIFYNLEELCSGYNILGRKIESLNIIEENFDDLFTARYDQEVSILERPNILIISELLMKLRKFKPYLSEETYQYWTSEIRRIDH
jgi:hypothetical protein